MPIKVSISMIFFLDSGRDTNQRKTDVLHPRKGWVVNTRMKELRYTIGAKA